MELSRGLATVVGVLWLTWLLLRILRSLVVNFSAFFLAPWGITRMNLKKQGPWAVVTGGSDGLGRGYALELARQGLNVVIISRTEEKLKKVAVEIREKYNRDVRIITTDFSLGLEIYPNIGEQLKDLDIGVLVNNVGIGIIESMQKTDSKMLYKITEVNCQAAVQMSKLVLPKMLEKKKGVIVNVSSGAGLLNTPGLVVYSATKSFVNSFSDGLHKECASKGITVQCVMPMVLATPPSIEIGVKPGFFSPDGITYARAAVATIGVTRLTRGYLSHALQGIFLDNAPSFILDFAFNYTLEASGFQVKPKED